MIHLYDYNEDIYLFVMHINDVQRLIKYNMVLWGAAIMAYKSIPAAKYWRKVVHLVLHLMALAAGIFGVCLAFKFHHEVKISDLLSLHSWLGLIAISLYALQVCPLSLSLLRCLILHFQS